MSHAKTKLRCWKIINNTRIKSTHVGISSIVVKLRTGIRSYHKICYVSLDKWCQRHSSISRLKHKRYYAHLKGIQLRAAAYQIEKYITKTYHTAADLNLTNSCNLFLNNEFIKFSTKWGFHRVENKILGGFQVPLKSSIRTVKWSRI